MKNKSEKSEIGRSIYSTLKLYARRKLNMWIEHFRPPETFGNVEKPGPKGKGRGGGLRIHKKSST